MKLSVALRNKWRITLWLLAFTFAPTVSAQNYFVAEFGYVIPGYNDVAVPGNGGTRFSLVDDLKAKNFEAFRFQYEHAFPGKHWVRVLAAPLTLRSRGVIAEEIEFNGVSFSSGSFVKAAFEFNSYRLIYRYTIFESDSLEFAFGGALKLREAAIELRSGSSVSRKENTGFVPLLSFHVSSHATQRLRLLIDGEALAAPQGRAEDILFATEYRFNPSFALRAGYRILEGGADNDEVYTFSLFHQFVVGASWKF